MQFRFTDGRLERPPAEKMKAYMTGPGLLRELQNLPYFGRVDMAWAVMLVEEGILDRGYGSAILSALAEMRQLGTAAFQVDPEHGSLLFQIERWLATKVGSDIAGRLHVGRGRADYGSAILTLAARDAVLETLAAVAAFQEILLFTASTHATTLMPGYTHLQQSQPTTYGHYMLSHFFAFERDFQRLQGVNNRNSLSPLGCPARSGASWPVNRRRVADLLGLDGITLSSHDLPYYRRDHMADFASAFSLLLSNLGRLATDLTLWTSQEFGFLEISDEYAGSSSIMPQKKNPEPLEAVRGLAGEAIGWMPAMLGVLKAADTSAGDSEYTPLHNGGLLREAKVQAVQALDMTGDILRTLRVNTAVMAESVRKGWSSASHMADVLARVGGLPFAVSHLVVGRLVRLAVQAGMRPDQVTPELLQEAATQLKVQVPSLTASELRRHLAPEEFVRTRVTEGGQQPEEVRRVIAVAQERLTEGCRWLTERRQALEAAEQELVRAAAAITGQSQLSPPKPAA